MLNMATKEHTIAVEKVGLGYRINKKFEEGRDVFVCGKIEKNFNSLKKEYFHALIISAVQELHYPLYVIISAVQELHYPLYVILVF
jgi:hypothetical protein